MYILFGLDELGNEREEDTKMKLNNENSHLAVLCPSYYDSQLTVRLPEAMVAALAWTGQVDVSLANKPKNKNMKIVLVIG